MARVGGAARQEIERLAKEHLDRAMRHRLTTQLDDVPSYLRPGEDVVLLTDADHHGCGLLVVTVDRLLFLPESGRPFVVLFDEKEITAEAVVSDEDVPIGDVVVSVDGERRVFEAVGDLEWATIIAAAINGEPPGDVEEGARLVECAGCGALLPPGTTCPDCRLVVTPQDVTTPTRRTGAGFVGPLNGGDGTARCPLCAEQVQPLAVVCRHCGADFRTGARGGATETNGLAIAAFVTGLLWVYGLGSLLALILGYTALRQIAESAGRQQGRGLAVAAIVLGWCGLGGVILVFVSVGSVVLGR